MTNRFLMYPEEDEPRGPYTLDEIALWQSQGALPPGTLVTRGDQWVRVDEELAAPGLAPAASAVPGASALPAHLQPSRPVLVRVPSGPPQQRYVGQVRDDQKRGVLPESAELQVAPGTPWIPVGEALVRYPELAPTRSTALVVTLVVVPTVLGFVQLFFVSFTGLLAMSLAWVVMGIAALAVNRTDALRSKAPLELLRGHKVASVVVGGTSVLLVATGLAQGLRERARDSRIDALVADPDPCAVERMSPADKDGMGWGQQSAYDDRVKACGDKRERAKADADKKELELECRRLSAMLTKKEGDLGSIKVVTEAQRPLLERIRERRLVLADLQVEFGDLPCRDTASAKDVEQALTAAARESATAWTNVTRVSDDLMSTLQHDGLAPDVKPQMEANTRRNAQVALSHPPADSSSLQFPVDQCDIAKKLDAYPKDVCSSLRAVYDRRTAAESAADDRSSALDQKNATDCTMSCFANRSASDEAADEAFKESCESQCGDDTTCRVRCVDGPTMKRCAARCGFTGP